MTTGDTYRDVVPAELQPPRDVPEGRTYIAVIGIDRYRTWNRLHNAVSDARGALKVFASVGFELVAPPLFDEGATGAAVRRLVIDDLSGLHEEDSLVLFFAGHGHTMTRGVGGASVRDGYLIPADGDRPGGRAGTWIRLESWLTEITRIPAKHILVILDACHSGLALGPIVQWRSRGMENARREPLEPLRARRSRRIITSALDDQLAMDGGPVPGHSLFTGCLVEAMTGGLAASTGYQIVTGSEVGHYVQRRVSEYPGSAQTPDFGALELDDRGELLVPIWKADADATQVVAGNATIVSMAPRKELLLAPGSRRLADVAGAASAMSNAPSHEPLSVVGRGRLLRLGGSAVMAIAGGTVALFVTCNSTFDKSVNSVLGQMSDAGVAVVTPLDAALAAATTDAAQHEVVEPEPLKTDPIPLQQPSRRVIDANASGADRPPIDDRGN